MPQLPPALNPPYKPVQTGGGGEGLDVFDNGKSAAMLVPVTQASAKKNITTFFILVVPTFFLAKNRRMISSTLRKQILGINSILKM